MATDPDVPMQHVPTADPAGESTASRRIVRSAAAAALACGALLSALAATSYISAKAIPGLPEPPLPVRFGLPVAHVGLDLATLLAVGLSVLPKLVGFDRPTEHVLSPARRASVIAALLWMLSALVALVLQAWELSPDRPLTTALLGDYIATVPAGSGLLISTGAGLVCAVLGLLTIRFGESVPAELRLIVAALGLLPLPLTGHAMDSRYQAFSMISIELHVIGAALWAGGLTALVLFTATHREILARALPRFSRLATMAIAVVGASGLFNGTMVLLNTPGAGLTGLFTTQYGQLVLAKLLCLLALAAIASQLRFRLLPRITSGVPAALLGWAAAELAVMGLAYGLGTVLSRAPVG